MQFILIMLPSIPPSVCSQITLPSRPSGNESEDVQEAKSKQPSEDFPGNRQLRKKLRIPLPQITTPFSENVTVLFHSIFFPKRCINTL